VLWNGRTAEAVGGARGKVARRLTYGSDGPIVDTVQQALRDKGFYEGEIDEDFGPRTLRAVIALQKHAFGADAADGIVGPNTAGALGIEWSQV
jgi:peptidoglycan hydrolase-like protein with peptidoglycan-binding domain